MPSRLRPTLRLGALLCAGLAVPVAGQTPRTHRLEATPSTVAYGYYWSEATPVLRDRLGRHRRRRHAADQLAGRAGEGRRAAREGAGVAARAS